MMRGRLIVYGHWNLSELYKMAYRVYELHGSEGVRVAIHHHLRIIWLPALHLIKNTAFTTY